MKNNIKEINFGEGIGELKFGMTKDQVSSLLGKPDEIENIPGIDEEVNDDLVSWHYDNLEISLVLTDYTIGSWFPYPVVMPFIHFTEGLSSEFLWMNLKIF